MNNNMLKSQHLMIRRLVNELEAQVHSGDVLSQAFELSLKIGKLSGTLVLHLKSEDEFLYPSLLKSTDPAVRRTAEAFNREMGTLAQEFMGYKSQYMLASNIKADIQKFIGDTQKIVKALKNRLDREDLSIYQLA